jgi:hypothetical protein
LFFYEICGFRGGEDSSPVFWVVTTCSVVVGYNSFRVPWLTPYSGRSESEWNSETLIFYHNHNTTWGHNPEELETAFVVRLLISTAGKLTC